MSLKMRYSLFSAMRTVTAKNPIIAIRYAHTFDPSCSNQLMVANQDAHAFRVIGWCQDDVCQSPLLRSSSFLLIFRFLASSILSFLAFHFSDVLERWFLNGSSRMVMRIGKCQDTSVGRNQREVLVLKLHPGLSQIGECHNLEVPPWDLWRPLPFAHEKISD